MSNKIEPIWVESCMTASEWKARYDSGLGSSSVKEYPQYDPNYYKGGTWRKGMGSTPSPQEMERRNKEIESLKQFNLTKKPAL